MYLTLSILLLHNNLFILDTQTGIGVEAVDLLLDSYKHNYAVLVDTYTLDANKLISLAKELKDGVHSEGGDCEDRAAKISADFDKLREDATFYFQQLNEAHEREAALLAKYKDFCARAGKINSWLSAISKLFDTPLPSPGAGITAIESLQDAYQAKYETQHETYRQLVAEMGEVSVALAQGKHQAADDVDHDFADMRSSLDTVTEKSSSFSEALQDAQQREVALVEAFRLFKSEATKLESWLENCNGMVTGTGHGKGAGLEKVESMSDTFKAKYTSQLPTYTKMVEDLSELSGELGAGGHSDSEKVQERLKNDTSQLEALKQQAAVYQEALEASLTREQQLVSSLKEFRAKASKVDSWIASIRAVVDSTDYEKGVGLAHIDDKLHTLQSEYDVQSPTFHNTLSDLASLADAIVEGQHADADATKAHFDDTNAKMTALDADAEAYQQRLNDAHAHEEQMHSIFKDFNDKIAKLESWCDIVEVRMRSVDVPHGCGLQKIETAIDSFQFEYQSQIGTYEEMLADLGDLRSQLVSGMHGNAQEATEQLEACTSRTNDMHTLGSSVSAQLQATFAHESDQVVVLKEFNSLKAKIENWVQNCNRLMQDKEFGLGINFDQLEIKLDAFNNSYTNGSSLHHGILEQLQDHVKKLESGNHVKAADVKKGKAALDQEVGSLQVNAQTYERQLQDALQREAKLIESLKAFNSSATKMQSWLDSCLELVGSNDNFGAGTNLSTLQALMDTYKTKYETQVVQRNSTLQSMNKLSDILEEGQHSDREDVKNQLSSMSTKMTALTDSAQLFLSGLQKAIAREEDLIAILKEFRAKSGKFESWVEHTTSLLTGGSSAQANKRLSTRSQALAESDYERGCGTQPVEIKLDAYRVEFADQQADFDMLSEHLKSLASTMTTGGLAEAPECVAKAEGLQVGFDQLKIAAQAYHDKYASAFDHESMLEKLQADFKAKSGRFNDWIENLQNLVSNANYGDSVHEIEGTIALFEAEYTSQIEEKNTMLKSIETTAASMVEGGHKDGNGAVMVADTISSAFQDLQQAAADYHEALLAALRTEEEMVNLTKKYNMAAEDFMFGCDLFTDKIQEPISRHNTEAVQHSLAAFESDLSSRFALLKEQHATLQTDHDGLIEAGKEVTAFAELDDCLQAVGVAYDKRQEDLEAALKSEQTKDSNRDIFAAAAREMSEFCLAIPHSLGAMDGSNEENLESVKQLQTTYASRSDLLEEVEKANLLQEQVGVLVNTKTPETIFSLRAMWEQTANILNDAVQSIEANIMAEKAGQLSLEQIKEIKEVFDSFDDDGSNTLEVNEFYDCATAIGIVLTQDEAQDAFNNLDEDKSGTLGFDEFVSFMAAQLTASDSQQDVKDAFEELADHSPIITTEKIAMYFKDQGMANYLESTMPQVTGADGSVGYDYDTFVKNIFETQTGIGFESDRHQADLVEAAADKAADRAVARKQTAQATAIQEKAAQAVAAQEKGMNGITEAAEEEEVIESSAVARAERRKSRKLSLENIEAAQRRASLSRRASNTARRRSSIEAQAAADAARVRAQAAAEEERKLRAKVEAAAAAKRKADEEAARMKAEAEKQRQAEEQELAAATAAAAAAIATAANEEAAPAKNEADAWVEAVDDSGNTYYYNEVSGASQWDNPHQQGAGEEEEEEEEDEVIGYATALYAYEATDDSQVSLKEGERIEILEKMDNGWTGARNSEGIAGYCPTAYVQFDE